MLALGKKGQIRARRPTGGQRYARKIEDLDDHQVDKEVVAFGRDAVDSLQEIVRVVDRVEMRTGLCETNLLEFGRSRHGRYGAYGFYEKPSVTRDRLVIQADELRELSAPTRKTMTERYGRQF